jgi:DNA repair exonuclease SbcCD nuclease subunit
LGVVKEIGAKYSFEVVNFDINRSISAKNNDIDSVRRNKVLIKINKDINDIVLSKAFEQSLCSFYVFDIKRRQNSVIIFYKTEAELLSRLIGRKHKDCLVSFAEFAFNLSRQKPLPELSCFTKARHCTSENY